ncbi:MAG: putative lipopolysaccharide heptosyltransferase III [Burkholderiales bacterium]
MNPPPRRVLVIITRRIGDVLLATPVFRSLRQAWPDATIDALVFSGTASVLAANADVNGIRVISERPGFLQHIVFIAKLFRRYDLALSLVAGDRPTLYAWLAGRTRAGLLLPTQKEHWKRRFLHHWVPYDIAEKHTVLTHLSLLEPLGVPAVAEVTASWCSADEKRVAQVLATVQDKRYVVLHLYPKFNYKMWSDAGWLELARWITAQGFSIVLTGSNDPAEITYVNRLAQQMDAPLNLAGQLTLNQSACAIAQAAAYVGPDTALTHMAAALGVPTVAFFGPTDPLKWGPWPKGFRGAHSPWQRLGDQVIEQVSIVQGNTACAPCNKEGCERRTGSFSDCLLSLSANRVINALRQIARIEPHP